jgi:hypothetical protein
MSDQSDEWRAGQLPNAWRSDDSGKPIVIYRDDAPEYARRSNALTAIIAMLALVAFALVLLSGFSTWWTLSNANRLGLDVNEALGQWSATLTFVRDATLALLTPALVIVAGFLLWQEAGRRSERLEEGRHKRVLQTGALLAGAKAEEVEAPLDPERHEVAAQAALVKFGEDFVGGGADAQMQRFAEERSSQRAIAKQVQRELARTALEEAEQPQTQALVHRVAEGIGEVTDRQFEQAHYVPWLPLTHMNPFQRIAHRYVRTGGLTFLALAAIGILAGLLIDNWSVVAQILVPSAYASAAVSGSEPLVRLSLLGLIAFVITTAFLWALIAAASKRPELARSGVQLLHQIVAFAIGIVSGYFGVAA